MRPNRFECKMTYHPSPCPQDTNELSLVSDVLCVSHGRQTSTRERHISGHGLGVVGCPAFSRAAFSTGLRCPEATNTSTRDCTTYRRCVGDLCRGSRGCRAVSPGFLCNPVGPIMGLVWCVHGFPSDLFGRVLGGGQLTSGNQWCSRSEASLK